MIRFSCVREDIDWKDPESEEYESTSYWVDPQNPSGSFSYDVDGCNTCGLNKSNVIHNDGGLGTHNFAPMDRQWVEFEDDEPDLAAKFILDFPYAVWDWCEGESEQNYKTGIWSSYTLFIDDEHQEEVFAIADKMNTGEWIKEKVENHVYQGTKVLDKRIPKWRQLIDLESLEMGGCSQCILGQIFGDYDDGLGILGLDYVAAEELGFEYQDSSTEYPLLKNAWTEAVLNPTKGE